MSANIEQIKAMLERAGKSNLLQAKKVDLSKERLQLGATANEDHDKSLEEVIEEYPQQKQREVYLNENTMKKEFRMIDSACLLFNYDKLSREQLIARRFYQLGLKAK